MDITIGLIVTNAEDITVRTIRQDYTLSVATLLAVGADSLYSKQRTNKNLKKRVTLYSFRIKVFQFRFLYTSRHFISILAMQEERNIALTGKGC